MSRAVSPESASPARRALERGRAHLLALQQGPGYWKAELETRHDGPARTCSLRQFLGIRGEAETRETAAWSPAARRRLVYAGGPSPTSRRPVGLHRAASAGDPPDSAAMRLAAERVRDGGGLEAARVFTRLWLALFGEWSWRELPALPPEVILLPPWFPLNIYDFGCWARQTIVPLTVVAAHRPARALGFSLAELRSGARRSERASLRSWASAFRP